MAARIQKKTKAAAATSAAPATVVSAVAPAAPAVVPAAEPAALDVDASKSRQQLSQILQINISQDRCATHLKQNLGDNETEQKIKDIRNKLKTATDEKEVAELKASITQLSRLLVRISSETPIATAVVLDCMVKEQLIHGMTQANLKDRKIVEIAHLHSGKPSDLIYYSLIQNCNTYTGYNEEKEEALRQERGVQNKAAKEARLTKKAADGTEVAPVEGAPVEAAEDTEASKTTFFTYVENALKSLKKVEAYKTMRVSNRVREYLSDIVAETITMIAELSRIIVQDVVEVRTMNAGHVKAIVRILMTYGGQKANQSVVTKQIDEKLEVYRSHLLLEKEKKTNNISEEAKQELKKKQTADELARKKKQMEMIRTRAVTSAQRVKTLQAETLELEKVQ